MPTLAAERDALRFLLEVGVMCFTSRRMCDLRSVQFESGTLLGVVGLVEFPLPFLDEFLLNVWTAFLILLNDISIENCGLSER